MRDRVVDRMYSRGGLPHWSRAGATQFLTWRLADSVPADKIAALHRRNIADEEARARFHRDLDALLDLGLGERRLGNPLARAAVVRELLSRHREEYVLHAFVVMPNHVHAMLTVPIRSELSRIVKTIKGATARAVNVAEGRTGTVWQPDYYDRVIRDDDHFFQCAKYIEWNPVKAGLCEDPRAFVASSANQRIAQELIRRIDNGLAVTE